MELAVQILGLLLVASASFRIGWLLRVRPTRPAPPSLPGLRGGKLPQPPLRASHLQPPSFPIPPSTGRPATLQGAAKPGPYRTDAGIRCPHCGGGITISRRGEA